MNSKKTLYHCCVHKTGSQWIKGLLGDQLIYKAAGLKIFSPQRNCLQKETTKLLYDNPLPGNMIISPFYCGYEVFRDMPKPEPYRCIFVMRDPRDILISWYFSAKFSHHKNPFIKKYRKILKSMDHEEGIDYIIRNFFGKNSPLFNALHSWYLNREDYKYIKIFCFEDLIGPNKKNTFTRLLNHLEIGLKEMDLEGLLDKYSFKSLSKGRNPGEENIKKHYRKGVQGDWENYFSENHKALFKELHGRLLIDLKYEKNWDW